MRALPLTLSPCAGEAELFDRAVTGDFAEPIANTSRETHMPPWCSYVARRAGVAAGFGGFKGLPEAYGAVELGYLTFPGHEGSGIASEFAAALVAIARAHGPVRVIAHTLCEPDASTRVLEKAGFVRDGFGDDPDEGQVWRWRLVG